MVRDPSHTYWFGFRQAIVGPSEHGSRNGLEVHFGGESAVGSSGNTLLLDRTPGSRGLGGSTFSTMHEEGARWKLANTLPPHALPPPKISRNAPPAY